MLLEEKEGGGKERGRQKGNLITHLIILLIEYMI